MENELLKKALSVREISDISENLRSCFGKTTFVLFEDGKFY